MLNTKCYNNGLLFFLCSALLYLNDDFEGGNFFFAHANKSEQVSKYKKKQLFFSKLKKDVYSS